MRNWFHAPWRVTGTPSTGSCRAIRYWCVRWPTAASAVWARVKTWPRRHSSRRGKTFDSCANRRSSGPGCAALCATLSRKAWSARGANRRMTPRSWKPCTMRRRKRRCHRSKPSAARRRRFCGGHWKRFPNSTGNRSSFSIANSNPSSPWRRNWGCPRTPSSSSFRGAANYCRRRCMHSWKARCAGVRRATLFQARCLPHCRPAPPQRWGPGWRGRGRRRPNRVYWRAG